ncbi:MAG: hypothetical protein L6R41_001041 [Letrouitia leprolyta]|nr:MAG: hypothetical protein L6R41_001041 [Letrouitia leprolyta]
MHLNIERGPYGADNHQPNRPLGARKGPPVQGPYYDGRRKSPRNRQQLFALTKELVRVDRGTPYPCYAKNLESYRCRPKRTRKAPMSTEVATNKLVNFLNQNIERGTKEDHAVRRLASGMQLSEWGPDLFIKAFDDLDLVFFRGVLAMRTQAHYMTATEMTREFGDAQMFGCTLPLGYGRCRIVLNSTLNILHERNPFAQLWNTLLHEMVVRDIEEGS